MTNPELRVLDGAGSGAAPDPVDPPEWLSDEAAEIWRALAPRTAPGTLTPSTAWAFAMLCTELATFADAEQLVQEAGIIVADGQNLVPNPALAIRRQADGIAGRWAAQFGLTPDSAAADAAAGQSRQMRHLIEGG
ncbi:P27 family phage terminase small subunit [Actinoallomurus sp. NPDC052274]|uniref:P27 family phage terminase small subunit n=1 Tax=Actinoallomurus sp. NPDC052274 TaxID=3155420 RepID=UPI0034169295